MVQVDVFWAYGFGASLAVAAGNRLVRENGMAWATTASSTIAT